jgi:type III secretory pathway component EscU
LVTGTYEHRKDLDAQITSHAAGYPLDRQTVVDKNILRLATAEILYSLSDAPIPVVVNKAMFKYPLEVTKAIIAAHIVLIESEGRFVVRQPSGTVVHVWAI